MLLLTLAFAGGVLAGAAGMFLLALHIAGAMFGRR